MLMLLLSHLTAYCMGVYTGLARCGRQAVAVLFGF